MTRPSPSNATGTEPSLARATTAAEVAAVLDGLDYLADEGLATAVLLALRLGRPLFLEGEPGAGKTELARTLAAALGADLLRLQCYEGLDAATALYDWDHARQLLHLRAAEAAGGEAGAGESADQLEAELYSERYLVRRPLLAAITLVPAPVLLIDEIDRADDEFEAFLLEVLGDWTVTVPELGTFRAAEPPVTVLTSNRTRDVHDALKRRCLYHWVEHPGPDRELAIVRRRVPDASEQLARQVAVAVAELRAAGLYKPPGVAESVDWAQALVVLGCSVIDRPVLAATLGAVVKQREDLERARSADVLDRVLDAIGNAG